MAAIHGYTNDTLGKGSSAQRKGFEIPSRVDMGVLQPCPDDLIEYEFSHVCPNIYWSPGTQIDPRKEIRLGAHFSMPFDLDMGSAMVVLKVEGQPIYEDRLDFTCDMLIAANDYVPVLSQCPILLNTNIEFVYTFTDILGLKAYPGDYEVEIRLKNIDGEGVCCTTFISILG